MQMFDRKVIVEELIKCCVQSVCVCVLLTRCSHNDGVFL